MLSLFQQHFCIIKESMNKTNEKESKSKRLRLGPVAQKILLFLSTGIALGLTRRPDYYFRVLNSASKEWNKINKRSLKESVRKLYKSDLINYRKNKDGTVILLLNKNGEKRVLECNLDKLVIKKPKRWDGYWRIIIFDIPEKKKQARDALTFKLKQLGLYQLQKSVYVYPYNCKDEIDFITEVFEVKPHVRFLIANYLDIASDLKQKFKLTR